MENNDDEAVAIQFKDNNNEENIFTVGVDTVFVTLEIKIPLNDFRYEIDKCMLL